jgi:anti-sigma-K factor RskA
VLIPMKNIPKAEAFAITLEKAGGSPTPTLTAMYVMGKV